MHFLVGVHRPAGQLFQGPAFVEVTELIGSALSWLYFHILEMNAALIDTDRSASLHPRRTDPVPSDALCQMGDCRLRNSATRNHLPTDMHQSVEEGSCRQHHTLRIEFSTPDGSDTDGLAVFNKQLISLILPDVEVGGSIKMSAPLPDELPSIALSPWTPDGRTLAHVEHTELNRGGIRYQTHLSAQGIDLANNLTLRDTSDSRVTRHLCNLVHVHRHQAGLGSQIGTCASRFTTRMTPSNDYHIILEFHPYLLFFRKSNKKN